MNPVTHPEQWNFRPSKIKTTRYTASEVGGYNISVITLERLCNYYGLTFEEFFEELKM